MTARKKSSLIKYLPTKTRALSCTQKDFYRCLLLMLAVAFPAAVVIAFQEGRRTLCMPPPAKKGEPAQSCFMKKAATTATV